MNGVRLALALVAAATLAAIVAGEAVATWAASGAGRAGAAARVMPTGSTPLARVSGTDVVVTWPAATIANGVGVEGYVVQREDAAGSVASVGTDCAGTVTALTCTEHNVPPGTWMYTDTPVQESWRGGQSPPSNAVQVPGG